MSEKIINYFGSNLKALRTRHKETQSDLAKILSVGSKEIGKYEHNQRNPSPETIKRVANHYGITVEMVLFSDFSKIAESPLAYDSQTSLKEATDILRFCSSEKALKNESFKEAYDIIESYSDDSLPSPLILKKCRKLYRKAWKEEQIPEAIENILLLRLTEWGYIRNEKMITNSRKLMNPPKNIKSYPKLYLNLRDSISDEVQEKRIEYYNQNAKGIWRDIKKLKETPEGREFGDYYIALIYKIGMVDNSFSREINEIIGLQMMCAQLYVGNKFAIEYFKANHLL